MVLNDRQKEIKGGMKGHLFLSHVYTGGKACKGNKLWKLDLYTSCTVTVQERDIGGSV